MPAGHGGALAAHPGRAWRARAALNGFGAVLTALALIDVTVTKFRAGAWLIVLVVPLLVLLFGAVRRAYDRIGTKIGVGTLPRRPTRCGSVVVVPVVAITRLTSECLTTALSMDDRVVAVHVAFPDEHEQATRFAASWREWRPEVPLALLHSDHRVLGPAIVHYLNTLAEERVFVLIGELEPTRLWERVLRNRRGAVVARAVGRGTNAVVCRLRFRLDGPHAAVSGNLAPELESASES